MHVLSHLRQDRIICEVDVLEKGEYNVVHLVHLVGPSVVFFIVQSMTRSCTTADVTLPQHC